VSDVNGQSPLFVEKGMIVNSPDANEGELYKGRPATISFKVKVNNESGGKEIENVANVNSRNAESIVSNKVITKIPTPLKPGEVTGE
ncbi:hypothetical protein ACFJYD_13970, partial [Enterococcus faecalis]